MPWFKLKKKKSPQPSPHSVSAGIPSRIDSAPPNIAIDLIPAVIVSGGGNDAGGSQEVVLLDGNRRDRRSHEDDVTRGPVAVDRCSVERNDHQETLPNTPSPEHFVSNTPSLFPERELEAPNRREYDQQEVVDRPAGIVPSKQVSSDCTGGDASDPVQSDRSELVEGTSRNNVIRTIAVSTNDVTGGFNSLIALLSAIYPRYREINPVGNKIQDLVERIIALEIRFDSRPSDVAEQRCRDGVIRKFKVIKQQLYAKPESQRPAESRRGDDGVLLLLEDIREIESDYQMEQQTRRCDQEYKSINRDEAAVLTSFRCASGAEFRHGDRKGCLKGTRGNVLDKIELWTRNFRTPPVYWLNGLAGTGKTTIAQTIAERTFANGQLGASFFCSRDYQDRRNLHLIFPTLAVQLARKYADFRSRFVPLVQADPGIAYESLYNQMRRLIVEHLKESNISTVIVIDALDECVDEEPASAILSVIGQFVSEIPKVKFLVTGRPEPRIREGFRLPLLAEATDVFILHEVEPSEVEKDIRLFFKHRFSELVRRNPRLHCWPTDKQLDTLCERAAGLFVYAVATVKFVEKQSANPRKQLDLLLKPPGGSSREGGTMLNTGATTLDSLYTSILLGAFGTRNDPDNDPRVRSVLGAMVLAANPLSPSTITVLLDLDLDDVIPLLSSVQSLLVLQENIYYPVRPFHKSFSDFIVDPDRCTNQRFHIFPPPHHSQLLMGCLDLMFQTLEKNMCKLPDAVANSDVSDMEKRTDQYISPALQYACRSWYTHLVNKHKIPVSRPDITSTLHRFLETKFLMWLEVLSVLGAARNAVYALQTTVDWLEESPAFYLACDCSRFISTYFDIIRASSPHIYHSALVLTPKKSILRKLYDSHARPFARVVYGLPASWDSHLAATTHHFNIQRATWSPCNRLVAVSSSHPGVVDILDSVTLQKLQSLKFPGDEVYSWNLIFSPDSRTSTACGYDTRNMFVVTWDLQTGGIVGVIEWDIQNRDYKGDPYITHSTSGRMVAILHEYHDQPISISICDIVSSKRTYDVDTAINAAFCGFWTHGESLWFAAIDWIAIGATGPSSITVWKVGFTPGAAITEVETFPVPESVTLSDSTSVRFPQHSAYSQPLPTPHLPIVLRDNSSVLVWDARTSKILLHLQGNYKPWGITCSSGGHFLVCSIQGPGIYLWKDSPTGYVLHGKLPLPTLSSIPLLSLNGESIIVISDSMIKLWHTESLPITPSKSFTGATPETDNFLLQFLPHRSLAVVSREGENAVVFLALGSGDPQLTINTGVEVRGLGAIEDTVVVISDKNATTWKLPGGSFLPGTTMNVADSTQTVDFGVSRRGRLEIGSISPDSRYILAKELYWQLHLHSATTGKILNTIQVQGEAYWFTPDGRNVGVITSTSENKGSLFEITTQGHLRLVDAIDIEQGKYGCPYTSANYQVTDGGWILGPSKERMLILPPLWRSHTWRRMWNGSFLALLHSETCHYGVTEIIVPPAID